MPDNIAEPISEPSAIDPIPDTQIAPFPTEALESPEIVTLVIMESLPDEETSAQASAPVEEISLRISEPVASTQETLSILDETEDAFLNSSDEDSGVPMLNIDLDRLTTADTLFSRRARTITIRNK